MYGLSGFRYIHKVVQPSLVSGSRTFASPEKKPGTRAQSSLLLPTPKLLSVTHLLSVSLDLLTLTTSCKRNPMVIPFCVWRLSLSVTFSGFVHVPLCLSIPFLALIMVHRTDVHFLFFFFFFFFFFLGCAFSSCIHQFIYLWMVCALGLLGVMP